MLHISILCFGRPTINNKEIKLYMFSLLFIFLLIYLQVLREGGLAKINQFGGILGGRPYMAKKQKL